MVKELKQECECGHAKEVHAPISLQGIYNDNKDEYDGECCVQYRGRDGYIKCCSCMQFKPKPKTGYPGVRIFRNTGSQSDY